MATRLAEFVAEELWLLIGVVTFALVSLAGIAGFAGLAGAISVVGWFLLTPIFLFWGEEITALLFDDADESSEPSARATEPGALEELKRRYAEGEIDDEEFEHRLERLVAVENLPDDLFTEGASTNADEHGGLEREYERER
ncbi:SHOCT domain-containing protein [Natronorubrum texcoconense]|uniref:Uncharacterized membrane protein n=1 Tax=Natronorubrum texcoconense TaxID=1095776 RepID=A0A1G8UPT7_9EURY|nr:SHOCT domain-containing protein [Natronorubrum texcoconense]SDJ55125.1 Uncharacterized membrane protein [Natronorubrum texcoconense]